ncbi:hypothetical protein [Phenylobacterium sp.]|jgi:hypothetical protein|uniref:hypothetical protein n=1 Tax=Phenylobacterium sp. TaxID=1871053 RepID=UPI002F93BA4F
MTTLTEIVASVVVHSSAVAFSHFGVQIDTPRLDRPTPVVERTVARTPQRKLEKLSDKLSAPAEDCPDQPKARILKA